MGLFNKANWMDKDKAARSKKDVKDTAPKLGLHVSEPLLQLLEHKMSADDLKEYKDAFAIFDKDGDGVITTKEVITVLRSLGQDPSQETAQQMINVFDDNGNGKIEFNEFLILMDKLLDNVEDDEVLAEIFNVIDLDGDGEISETDLRRTAYRLGSTFRSRELKEMIEEFDKDGDGLIDFEEFKKIMNSRP